MANQTAILSSGLHIKIYHFYKLGKKLRGIILVVYCEHYAQ